MEERLVEIDDIEESEREVFDECSNTYFPFRFGTKWVYTCKDRPKEKLRSKEMAYGDDSFRKFVKITLYNQEREILNESEYATFNDKKDSKYKLIEVGCFDDFFGIISYTENRINSTLVDSDLKLACYTYGGQLIGNFEPLADRFGYYTHKELENFIDMVKLELAKQEDQHL